MSKKNVSSPWLAIRAGLDSIRGVAADKDAIMGVLGKFTSAAAKVSKPGDGSPQTGRFTGLRVMNFQDLLYGHNMTKGWGFTDAELAVAWKGEFPTAKCDFAEKHGYVTSARTDLNRGKRGMQPTQLNAQFGFEGPVTRFYAPVKPVKAKAAKPTKAKVADPVEPETPATPETVEPEAVVTE